MRTEPSSVLREGWSAPRLAWAVAHLAQLGGAYALIDRGAGDQHRRDVLGVFAALALLRLASNTANHLAYRISWREAFVLSMTTGAYQLGFAYLGSSCPTALDGADVIAALMFGCGLAVGVAASSRAVAPQVAPHEKGLCTRGVYRWVRHPHRLAELLCVVAWATAARHPVAALIVLVRAAHVLLVAIPQDDRRMSVRFGPEYREWSTRSARIVPFLY